MDVDEQQTSSQAMKYGDGTIHGESAHNTITKISLCILNILVTVIPLVIVAITGKRILDYIIVFVLSTVFFILLLSCYLFIVIKPMHDTK